MAPVFLSLAEVLAIHEDQIARYGGDPRLREIGLLKSAVGAPVATFGGAFLHADCFEVAAACLFHITQHHPFVDGNKPTGAASALVFLILNGQELNVSPDDLADLVLAVAEGSATKSDVAIFLRDHSKPV